MNFMLSHDREPQYGARKVLSLTGLNGSSWLLAPVLQRPWMKRRAEGSRAGEAETPCSCFWKVKPGLGPGGGRVIGRLREGDEAEEEPP